MSQLLYIIISTIIIYKRQTDRQTDRQTESQIERERETETKREAERERFCQLHIYAFALSRKALSIVGNSLFLLCPLTTPP